MKNVSVTGQMPDITPAQIKALVVAVVGLLAAFGLPISQEKQDALFRLVEILPVAIVIADAVIRHGRSRALANPESIRELERPAEPVVRR